MCIRDRGKSIKLNEKSIGGPFGGASAEAWLCEKCKKISLSIKFQFIGGMKVGEPSADRCV